jgi:hypothetical protein
MRNLKKKLVTGNGGSQKECWVGLEKGDKLLCVKTERGLLDVGMSGMTVAYDCFVKGKEYEVDHLYNWHGTTIAYVLDEDNCCSWATTELFELIVDKFEKRKDIADKLLGK